MSPPLCKLLYNSLIQPHFDYACSAWYPNQNKKLKSKFEILQSKCIRFCLNLNNRAHVRQNEFEKINWLPVNDCFEKIISSMSFKFCNNTRPPYMNDVFKPTGQPNTTTRTFLRKLNQPLRRTNHGQKNISYITPIIWNNLPNSLKTTDKLNSYKNRGKEHFLHRIKTETNNVYRQFNFFNAQPLFIFHYYYYYYYYCYYYQIIIIIIIAIIMTFISGSSNSSSSSSTSSSIIIIIIIISSSSINNIFVLLLYQPLFLRVSYVSCCFASIYPTTNFLRDHNGSFFTKIFNLYLYLYFYLNLYLHTL